MKVIVKIAIALIVLLVVAVVSLHIAVNTSFVRDKVKNLAESTLHRSVSIEKLRVHFLKGLSLSLNKFYIYEKDKKTIFAGMESFDIGLKILPLLNKKIDISSITINKPEITIVKTKDNNYNFSDITGVQTSGAKAPSVDSALPQQPKAESAQKEETKYSSILIGDISINDASVTLKQEAQDGAFKEFLLSGLSLDIKDFSFDKPLNFNLTSRLNKKAQIECRINTNSIQDITKMPEQAELDIAANIKKLSSEDLAVFMPPDTLKNLIFSDLTCAAKIKGSIQKGLKIEGEIATAPVENNINLAISKAQLKCLAEKSTAQNTQQSNFLETIKINGTIDAESITYKNNTLTDIRAAINHDKGTLSLKDISAGYSGGTIKGNTSFGLIDLPQPFMVDFHVAGIEIKDVLTSNIGYGGLSGILKADMSIQGKGFDSQSINKYLSGKADMAITDGIFAGKNLKQEILMAMENPLLAQAFPGLQKAKEQAKVQKKETRIYSLTAKTTLGNAVCNVNTLICTLDSADINGSGTINYDMNANLKAQMLLSKEFTQTLLAVEPGKEKNLPNYLPQENGRLVLPATITGPIKDPSIMPDFSIIISSLAKGALQDSLGKTLEGKGETGEKKSGLQNTLQNMLGGGGSGQENTEKKKTSPFKLF